MEELEKQLSVIVQKIYSLNPRVALTRPEFEFGDFSTNIAMQLAKDLGRNPREIAEEIKQGIEKNLNTIFQSAEIAGPGFINLKLTDKFLLEKLNTAESIPQILKDKVVVAEYSDPNPFKTLHAGHLYTTLVGDAISRLLEVTGAKIHRLNYGGDVGLHVGKCMWAIMKYIKDNESFNLSDVAESERLDWLSERYVEGHNAYESNETDKNEIVEVNKKVYLVHSENDHDSEFAKVYWTAREWSYDGFDELYKQLQVSSFEKYVPESVVTPLGLEIVNKGLDKGIFKKSDGAVVFNGEEHGLHTRVFINSAGLPTYEAKELGLAATKWQEYNFDLSVIITGNDIIEYMKVIIKALANFYPEVVQRTRHITHGMIKLPGGVKMSSRKGNVLTANDILDAAHKAGKEVSADTSEDTVLASVKYAFLKSRIGGDVIYDPEESIATEGNSGPYLQYAHARAKSILAKASVESVAPKTLVESERNLALKISEFTDIITIAAKELTPHIVCTYLYELAQIFNRFYEQNRVIGDARQAERLFLIEKYTEILKKGLNVLGITAPEKM